MRRVNKGQVPARRQARHFTTLDQVTQLVAARDADPELGFMARLLALCSLPRSNPGNRLQYVRRNGPYALVMSAGGLNKLPYGTLPRLLLAWVSTEAVRTQSRELILGDSLAEFMRRLDIYNDGGAMRGRLQEQMRRLFNAHVHLIYEDAHGEASVNSLVADRTEFGGTRSGPTTARYGRTRSGSGKNFSMRSLRTRSRST